MALLTRILLTFWLFFRTCLMRHWRGLLWLWLFTVNKPPGHFYRKAADHDAADAHRGRFVATDAEVNRGKPLRANRKPEWVVADVINIKAHMPRAGCRKVAQTFNQQHAPAWTVSKSFVADVLKRHQYALWCLCREIKNKKPIPTEVNAIWAMDLTFQADQTGAQQTALGILDHGSRWLVWLRAIITKNSWILLG